MASRSLAIAAAGPASSGMKCKIATTRMATGCPKSIRRQTSGAWDLVWPGQVAGGGRGPRSGQQGARVADHHRIVVHVDHVRVLGGAPGDLVHVLHGGQAGANVEELRDPGAGA